MYNISPNGEYLGLFKYPSFLEIYKFDGSKYNLHRRKTAINFFNLNPNTINMINSISNDGTIVSITELIFIGNPADGNYVPVLTQIYRLN